MTTRKGFGLTTTIDGRRYRIDITALALHLVQCVPDFGSYARERREFLNLSQQAVAYFMRTEFDISWHQTVVAKIESGERQVKLVEALALSLIYGLSLDDLVMGTSLDSTGRLVDLSVGDGED